MSKQINLQLLIGKLQDMFDKVANILDLHETSSHKRHGKHIIKNKPIHL